MSLYYARYKGTDLTSNIRSGNHYYIKVDQFFVTKTIDVIVDDVTIPYPNLDAFLANWDEFEREVEDKSAALDRLLCGGGA